MSTYRTLRDALNHAGEIIEQAKQEDREAETVVADADRVIAERRRMDRRAKTSMPKFRCPVCQNVAVSYVIESRPNYTEGFYWRRHLCTACSQEFTSTERVDAVSRPTSVSQHLAS